MIGLRELFADVLQIDPDSIDPDASFVDLGGNSLTYVAMSVRLERALGRVAVHSGNAADARAGAILTRRDEEAGWGATLETSVALRGVAIVLSSVLTPGCSAVGWRAHAARRCRVQLRPVLPDTRAARTDRVRHLRNTIAWIAGPSMAWVVIALVITDDYHATNLLLANKFLGPHDSMTAGRLWFVEVLVWTLVALAACAAAGRWTDGNGSGPSRALAFLAFGLALRYDALGLHLGRDAWFSVLALWFFAVGWAAAKSSATCSARRHVALIIGMHGYFDRTEREMLVCAGLPCSFGCPRCAARPRPPWWPGSSQRLRCTSI